MTFGARVGRLRSDAWIHRLGTVPKTPRDRTIWRCTQGEKEFFWKFPKRTLIGPIPSLATHMDPEGLSPNVDWEAIAEEVENSKFKIQNSKLGRGESGEGESHGGLVEWGLRGAVCANDEPRMTRMTLRSLFSKH